MGYGAAVAVSGLLAAIAGGTLYLTSRRGAQAPSPSSIPSPGPLNLVDVSQDIPPPNDWLDGRLPECA